MTVSRSASTAPRLISPTTSMYADTGHEAPVAVCSAVAMNGANPPPKIVPTA